MNTKIIYQYRDSENYKKWKEVVIHGEISLDDLAPLLYEGEFFIPSVIGFEDLQPLSFQDYDHVWHEILEIVPTYNQVSCNITASCVHKYFKQASDNGWDWGVAWKYKNMLSDTTR